MQEREKPENVDDAPAPKPDPRIDDRKGSDPDPGASESADQANPDPDESPEEAESPT